MTIAVDLGRKATKQTNKTKKWGGGGGGGRNALGIEGLLDPDPSLAESLCCVLEQVTLSAA